MSAPDPMLDLMACFDVGFEGSPVDADGAEVVEEGNSYRLIRIGDALYRLGIERALPANVRLSKDQASPPITLGESVGDALMRFSRPELEGVQTQIQHPAKSGKPPTQDPGMIGASILLTADGPRFMIQMNHPDGTTLGAIMFPDEYLAFGDIYVGLGAKERLIARSAGQKPS